MTKPDKNFRITKSTKRKIALMCGNADQRTHFKAMMIQAELAEVSARKQALKSKGAKGKDNE